MPPPPYVQPPASSLKYMRRRQGNIHYPRAALRFSARASGFLRYPFAKVYRRQMWVNPGLAGKRALFSTFSPFRSQGQQAGMAGPRRRSRFRWWHVPVAGGLVTAVFVRSKKRIEEQSQNQEDNNQTGQIRPAGPWQVYVYSTLPLKGISRLWGKFNAIELPMWMREPGYKLYSYVFGVNLDEVGEQDLRTYRNLGEFFYRELKPGVRPIDPSLLVSPADGKILHLGMIYGRQVEQVKGMTYSLDALLGKSHNASSDSLHVDFDEHEKMHSDLRLERDREFAVVNGIKYSLDDLIGGAASHTDTVQQGDAADSTSALSATARVTKEIGLPSLPDHEMFFCVIYLAPGDYHRFHSPTNWVAETRRHFAGELFSVAPYFQHRLNGLFVLNERVALLGRWRHGFFSMTPVGATNVGSIKVHFDKDLKTNEPSASATADETNKPVCYEATYARASKLLGGYPLEKGQQMGGFNLGSTVVLVFEAPKQFKFDVKPGEKVKVGQKLGDIFKAE
ncbi:phosphatidylserine decarboxylase-domain-containing protein [Dipodascopsis uninucleata]